MFMKARFLLWLLVGVLCFSCQSDDLEVSSISDVVENERVENVSLYQLQQDLYVLNNSFKCYLDSSTVSTRGFREFLLSSVLIAGADMASMIAAGSGVASMINAGIITPPGAAAFVTALTVCGAAGSLACAVNAGIIKLSTMTTSNCYDVTMHFADERIFSVERAGGITLYNGKPLFMSTRMSVPRDYKELADLGCLHNQILYVYLRGIYRGVGGDSNYIGEWKANVSREFFNRSQEPNSRIKTALIRANSPKQGFSDIVNILKTRKYASNEVCLVVENFFKSFILCKDEVSVSKLVNDYVVYLWQRKALFTEKDFQVLIAGLSVARESPMFWESLRL